MVCRRPDVLQTVAEPDTIRAGKGVLMT